MLTARFFLRRLDAKETEWRERERRLTDELLRYAHVPPLAVKQERVAKIPDPEVAPLMDDVERTIYEDDLLEDLQHYWKLGEGMSPAEAKAFYPNEWQEVERQYLAQRKLLRVV